jgi:uncharacterized RDD family membrane protein YckC
MEDRLRVELAGLAERFLSYFILDLMVIMTLANVGAAVWHLGAASFGGITLLKYVFLVLGIACVYFIVGNSLGQTVGKTIVGIKAVKEVDGSRPGLGWGTVRTLGYGVSAVASCLGFCFAAWDDKYQGWHDTLARTIVVRSTCQEWVAGTFEAEGTFRRESECSDCGSRLKYHGRVCPNCGPKNFAEWWRSLEAD